MVQTIAGENNDGVARNLVLASGWNSTCYQILNSGISRWVSADQYALVGFVRANGIAVVAGAPVCQLDRLGQTANEWEGYAAGQGMGVCYFGAEGRLREHLRNRAGYTLVVLGWQPEWTPKSFIEKMQSEPSLRAQLNRVRNKRVTIEEWPREQAENHPGLRLALKEWLQHRGLPPLHFLVEPETLSDLRDRRIFVAHRDGEVLAFVTLCPVPARNGWLTEQYVRRSSAPNGVIESLLFRGASAIAEAGAEYLTMGMVPLAERGVVEGASTPNWMRPILGWAKAHGNRFYNFQGLEAFKAKFRPDSWQPVSVIVKADTFQWRHLRAIGAAFAHGSPELAVAKGLLRAAAHETRSLIARN
ncbi:MAG: DUF2156 domain-containing protein [Armatimonadetes bacterium]|nr:DUF2156 domain-containing protein [Armatimonadota bacterium]